MEQLTAKQCQYISGGDGHFRVVIFAAVSPACALYVSNLYEQVLVGKITRKDFYKSLIDSSFNRTELEAALEGLEVIHWP
jgi:hypothetical protein